MNLTCHDIRYAKSLQLSKTSQYTLLCGLNHTKPFKFHLFSILAFIILWSFCCLESDNSWSLSKGSWKVCYNGYRHKPILGIPCCSFLICWRAWCSFTIRESISTNFTGRSYARITSLFTSEMFYHTMGSLCITAREK